MPHQELQQIIDWTIMSMKSDGQLSDDFLQALRALLPDNTIIAAFDLIDRGRVFEYKTPWGRVFFDVCGSKGRYAVSVDLPTPNSVYCACPAFVYNVLLSERQAMCKHILAVQIARKMGKCVERMVTQDELVALLCPDNVSENDHAETNDTE